MKKNMRIFIAKVSVIIIMGCIIGVMLFKKKEIDLEGTISGVNYKITEVNGYENKDVTLAGFYVDKFDESKYPYV